MNKEHWKIRRDIYFNRLKTRDLLKIVFIVKLDKMRDIAYQLKTYIK